MLEKSNIEDIIALTPTQEGILFNYLLEPESKQYYVYLFIDLCGNIDFEIFEKAWNIVIENNEMLRTVFRWEGLKKAVQIVLKSYYLKVKYYDFSNVVLNEQNDLLNEHIQKDRNIKLDLTQVSFNISLYKISENKYKMFIFNHHILYDGWSLGVMIDEFIRAYTNLFDGTPLHWSNKTKFKEYVKYISKQDRSQYKLFWQKYLGDFESKIDLLKKPKTKTVIKDVIKHNIELDYTVVNNFTRANNITLACFLHSVWAFILHRYNNSDDIIFGTTLSGRNIPIKGISNMVGMFINTLPFRIKFDSKQSFLSFSKKVDSTLQQLYIYENTPLVDIKEYSELKGSMDLFDTLMVIENYPLKNSEMKNSDGIRIESYTIDEMTNYDLTVIVTINEKTINVNFVYNKEVYASKSIEALAKHFSNVVDEFVSASNKNIDSISILTEKEKDIILVDFNNNKKSYDTDLNVMKQFEIRVQESPNNIAVVYNDMGLTYDELNRKSNQLARLLRENGVKSNSIVGILVDRSFEMLIGIFGILKAGGAYLPINTEYPKDRIDYLLDDSKVQILLTKKAYLCKNDFKVNIVLLDDNNSSQFSDSNLTNINKYNDLMYVIYTSGSTGKPKGVMIEHKSVVNILDTLQDMYPLQASDAYLLKTSFTFDVSVSELFGWFFNGGKLVILENNEEKNPAGIINAIEKNEITHINFVPSMLNAFLSSIDSQQIEIFSMLKYVFVAGEALSTDLVKKYYELVQSAELINLYGPTEATVYATVYPVSKDDVKKTYISIGKPVRNLKIYILDKNYNPQPINVPGEIFIAGVGLARGYANRMDLTSKMFIQSPFNENEILYKTGDLGNWLDDGNIEFLGRNDNQIKIRGYRIELGEIETHLLENKDIREAIVTIKEDIHNKYICAYYVSNQKIHTSDLRDFLLKRLPEYMIPNYFINLDKMPLNYNGKIDKSALPEPIIGDLCIYKSPEDDLERKLIQLFAEALDIEKAFISLDSNFFEIGGHSINCITVISRIHKEFNISISISEVFYNPVIADLAKIIRKKVFDEYSPIKIAEKKEYYPLSPAQERLYFVHMINPNDINYNLNLAIEMEGIISKEKLELVFKKLIERHESLRTAFVLVHSEPVQIVYDDFNFSIEYFKSNEDEVKEIIKEFLKPFEIGKLPLWRVGIMEIGTNRKILIIDMHHIIVDGISCDILKSEFKILLEGGALPALKLQYKDYVEWLNNIENNQLLKKQEEYWKSIFSGNIPVLSLRTDRERMLVENYKGSAVSFYLDEEITQKLKDLATEFRATLFMLFLAIMNVLLFKLTGDEDIIIGTVTSGRRHHELNTIVGMFVNTLAIRNFPNKDKHFETFLNEIRESTLSAYENQEYPFDRLIDLLAVKREVGRNPLFDVMLVLQDFDRPMEDTKDLRLNQYEYQKTISKFDLILSIVPGDRIFVNFEYNTDLFEEATINKLSTYFYRLISSILKNPKATLLEVDILEEEEKRAILEHMRKDANHISFIKNLDNKESENVVDINADFNF